jgi:hypothetical protein
MEFLISWNFFYKKYFIYFLSVKNFSIKKKHMLKKSKGLERNLALRGKKLSIKEKKLYP